MEKNITVKNENEMTEERKTIRERVKEILESINEKAWKHWAGDDSALRYMKHYRFLQKDMSREVTTKEFEEWLEDTMKKHDCKDSDNKAYAKSELMKDLDFEYKSMKRRAEELEKVPDDCITIWERVHNLIDKFNEHIIWTPWCKESMHYMYHYDFIPKKMRGVRLTKEQFRTWLTGLEQSFDENKRHKARLCYDLLWDLRRD
jgi:truncated hemoglobin YjbI